MLVKVKGRGVKLAGRWYFKNQEAEIDEKEYEANIEYLDIIKGEKEDPELPQVPGKDDEDEEEKILNDLREKAKSLKIKNAHLMGKEKLEIAIAEAEAPMFGTQNDSDENNSNENEDNKKGEDTEQNPQE